jgi:Fe-S-cluster containining protein
MNMQQKMDELIKIYHKFSLETEGFRTNAACTKGCAFCCTNAGSIDITTLEGLRIRKDIDGMLRNRRNAVAKVLTKEMKKREAGIVTQCPFLQKNKACMIYEVRPFSCRRIYSLHRCSKEAPPLINRQYMSMANKTLTILQQLDRNGYSGHISYILHMLDSPQFIDTYLAEEFRPEEITVFGKTHRIIINRTVTN